MSQCRSLSPSTVGSGLWEARISSLRPEAQRFSAQAKTLITNPGQAETFADTRFNAVACNACQFGNEQGISEVFNQVDYRFLHHCAVNVAALHALAPLPPTLTTVVLSVTCL